MVHALLADAAGLVPRATNPARQAMPGVAIFIVGSAYDKVCNEHASMASVRLTIKGLRSALVTAVRQLMAR